jgi:hypothetical protein
MAGGSGSDTGLAQRTGVVTVVSAEVAWVKEQAA